MITFLFPSFALDYTIHILVIFFVLSILYFSFFVTNVLPTAYFKTQKMLNCLSIWEICEIRFLCKVLCFLVANNCRIFLRFYQEILTYVKHFSINNVHTLFTSSNSKTFLRNNIFFYNSLTRISALFPLLKIATFYSTAASQTEELWVH